VDKNETNKPYNTLFLDRDGVINVRNFDGYITSTEDFKFAPKVIEGLQLLSPLFDRIIVVTNQQCIAKNILSKSNLDAIHRYMLQMLETNKIHIAAVYVAENLKGAANDRRKPLPVMGFEAKIDYPTIDFKSSWMVGDTDSDIKFGMNLGMHTAAIKSKEQLLLSPSLLVDDLVELFQKIKNIYP
jgi:histidinol-phosphate phosphatase family protein